MDASEILLALRRMRSEYSPVGQNTDRNDRGMPENDWAESLGRHESREEIRDEVCRDLNDLIAHMNADLYARSEGTPTP